jgi:polar amino acid transport system substrate-binding protein
VRILTAIVTVFVLAAGLGACGKHGAKNVYSCPNKGSGVGFKAVKSGKLTVQASVPATGFWNGADVDSLTGGYEFALAKDLCAQLGISKVRVVDQSTNAIAGGTTSDFDLALSEVSTTVPTASSVSLSTGYLTVDQGIMVNTGTTVPNLAAARKLKWGFEAGTTSGAFLSTKVVPTTAAKSFSTSKALFAALKAKTIDAVLIYTPVALAQASSQGASVVGQFASSEQLGVVLPKSSANTKLVNTALAKLKSDGTLTALAKQWLPGSTSSVPYITAP